MRRPSGTREIPDATISSGLTFWIGLPSNRISPALGGTMPEMDMRVVVLPAPFAPIRVMISPSDTSMERSFNTWTLP